MGKNNRLNMQIKKNRHYPCKKQMMLVFCALAGVLIGTAGGVTVWASENAVQESGLTADQLVSPADMEDTADYNDISLYKDTSYMKAFYDQFYADDKQREFYENPEDYVSDYAGLSGIFEDIAESFMQFVLSDRQDGDSLAAAKINFFYDYPEMTAKRDYIRQNFGYE